MTTKEDQRKIALSYLHAMRRDIKAQVIERPDSYSYDMEVAHAANKAERALKALIEAYETGE